VTYLFQVNSRLLASNYKCMCNLSPHRGGILFLTFCLSCSRKRASRFLFSRVVSEIPAQGKKDTFFALSCSRKRASRFLLYRVVSEIPAQGRYDKLSCVVVLFLDDKHFCKWEFGGSTGDVLSFQPPKFSPFDRGKFRLA